MVEVKSLGKHFGSVWALRDVSWSAEKGRSLGLLGPNGAGKSTTLKIMTGLLHPSEGEVLISGQRLSEAPIEIRKQIGFLPENPPLYDELTVRDSLAFICGLRSVPSAKQRSQIDLAIDKLQLQEMAYRRVRHLSKGYRQRVGIAQALIGDPSILIFDEPSVGLDPNQVVELRNIIVGLKKDHLVILSSHVLSEVQQICDDIVIMSRGEVKAKGTLQGLLQDFNKTQLEDVFVAVTQ